MSSNTKSGASTYWQIIKILLAVVLAGFVLSRTSLSQLAETFKSLSIGWLVCSLLLFLLTTLLKALQYYALMREKVTYPQVLNIVVVQNAVSNFLATSAGIASYLASFRVEHNVKLSRSAIVFILTKIGDLVALWIALFISSLLAWNHLSILKNLVLILLAGIAFAIGIIILAIIFRHRFLNLLGFILNRTNLMRLSFVQKGMDTITQLVESMERRRFLNILLMVCLLSSMYLAATLLWIYSNFMVFQIRINIVDIIFVNVLLQLISYVPIQIFGGLGVNETTALYFWNLLKVPNSVIVPFLVGNRILYYLMNLVPLIYLPLYTVLLARNSKLTE
jgi:uncharacterized membrane protein YbhN (UPF0104 family)